MKLLTSISVFLIFTAFLPTAFSQTRMIDTWSSVRAQGMGGAFTAVVSDSDALFYNPAGLAKEGGFTWTILDPRFGANGLQDLAELQDIVSSSSDMVDTLQRLYGRKVWAEVGAKTAVKVSNFAVAGFVNSNANIALSNPANTTMDLNYFFDYGVALGAGFSLVPDVWKIGVTAKRIDRTGAAMKIGAATLATLDMEELQNELQSRGIGYGVDVGTLLTVPNDYKPTLSVVYRNVGATSFSHTSGAHAPPSTPGELVVGASMEIKSDLAAFRPALDYRYADKSDITIGKKVHVGLEVDLPALDLRVGLNQGYYTAGVGLDFAFMRLDVATYGVELGAYPGQQEDRRYVLQATFDMSFEPIDFGLGDSAEAPAARRRLKQRR